MKCSLCEEYPPIRSNVSIQEELDRLSAYLTAPPEPSCPNPSCVMHGVTLSQGGSDYAAFGETAAGTPRWRCNVCRKTFTVGGKSTRKHKAPHKNRDVLMLLMNKMPLSRIEEVTGLDCKSLYGKINFIHRQFMLLAQNREKTLLEGFSLPKMYVAVDRQMLMVNWNSRKERRNVQLNAIGTADLSSGYVFGMHLNFDDGVDPNQLDALAQQAGDYLTPEPYRKYARFWLKPDYDAAIAKASSNAKGRRERANLVSRGTDSLTAAILGEYAAAKDREDIEDSDEKNRNVMLPTKGVQVREQYTMQAHFLLMAKLFANAPKVRFYMDQDSGFRAAFLSAFHERVKARTADAWYVKVLKDASIDEKNQIVAASRTRFRAIKEAHPNLTDHEIQIEMAKTEMRRAVSHGFPDDWWLMHPMPNKSEPEKQICWLTNLGDYDEEHAARLYLKASLHAIDRFFMLVRRRLSFAERAIGSASQQGRKWYGYNAYRPDNLAKLLDIFRVFYNYCITDSEGKTPAMKLGLARGPVAPEAVLYFEPALTSRKSRTKRATVKDETLLEIDDGLPKPWAF